jgi:hypothetical protein
LILATKVQVPLPKILPFMSAVWAAQPSDCPLKIKH